MCGGSNLHSSLVVNAGSWNEFKFQDYGHFDTKIGADILWESTTPAHEDYFRLQDGACVNQVHNAE